MQCRGQTVGTGVGTSEEAVAITQVKIESGSDQGRSSVCEKAGFQVFSQDRSSCLIESGE